MRLRHIEVFHAVMRGGSVSAAASLLNLSQSAASKALAQAEFGLGLRLFERQRGRLIPTREAEQLFSQTRMLFAQADRVERFVKNLARSPGGHLRIGCVPSLGTGLLPAVVRHFRAQCPEVSVELLTSNTAELAENVLARDIDIAVAFERPLTGGLTSIRLGQARAVHLSPGAVADGTARAVDLASLDGGAWIGIGGADPLARRIHEVRDGLGLPEWNAMVETRTYAVACALVREGLGFAIVDEFTAANAGADMVVRDLRPGIAVEVIAIEEALAQRSAARDAFLACVQARFTAAA